MKSQWIEHNKPPSIEITTNIGCPLMCSFCPQKSLTKAYNGVRQMSMETFEMALSKLSPHTTIHFSGMSEPWVNPLCGDMLSHALNNGFNVAVYTTLVGMSMVDVELFVKLYTSHKKRFETVCIHLPDDNGNMRGWKCTESYLNALTYVIESIGDDCEWMTMDGTGLVHQNIKHLVPNCRSFEGHSRAGSLDMNQIGSQKVLFPPKHIRPITCYSTPKYDRNVLLPNGDVVLCCMDYGLNHIIGNINKQTHSEILSDQSLRSIIDLNERDGYSNCSICKSCSNVRFIDKRGYLHYQISRIVPKGAYRIPGFSRLRNLYRLFIK